jgi:amino acid transporter
MNPVPCQLKSPPNTSFSLADASPFVVAISLAQIQVLPDIINASLLVFTLSAASSGVSKRSRSAESGRNILTKDPKTDIYCASRSLYGLAKDGQAFQIFSKTRANGNPAFAVLLSSVFAGLAYMNASKSAAQVFQYLVSLVTIFAVLNWVAILVSYISFKRALRAQGITPKMQPYVGYLQPYGAYFALSMSLVVVVFQGKNESRFAPSLGTFAGTRTVNGWMV